MRNMFKHSPRSGIYIYVQRTLAALIAGLICLFGFTTDAAHTRASLLLSASAAKPGDTITAAVRLQMDKGWHTYWKNGGDSGGPTTIAWDLPPGVTAGEIQWPLPEKLTLDDFTTYNYDDEAILLVPLKLATALKPGPLESAQRYFWLGPKLASAFLSMRATTCTNGSTTSATSYRIAVPSTRAISFGVNL